MLRFAYVTGALALIVTPAAAQAPESKAAEAKTPAHEKLICKREEQIGSRLAAKKVCLTASEWQQVAQANREETERVQLNTQVAKGN